MSEFKKPSLYSEKMTERIVKSSGFTKKPMNNRQAASILGVDEKTIRNWRKLHREFERAFIEAAQVWADRGKDALWDMLGTRQKFTYIKDADGAKVIKDDVLPTHNAVLALNKLGLKSLFGGFEEQEKSQVIADIGKRYLSGKIGYIDALCESEAEGVSPPMTWQKRELAKITAQKRSKAITASEAVEDALIAGLAVPVTWIAEANKENAVFADDIFEPTDIRLIDLEGSSEKDA